ncbi:MAG: hypothetical protein ABIH40_04025 [Candidatus Omnitrophota bacterium]
MKKDYSPEERLLRLIRGEKRLEPSKSSSSAGSSSRLRQKLRSKFSQFQIQDIQRLLWGALFISFLYLLICHVWPLWFRQKDYRAFNIIGEENSGVIEEEIKPEVKPYSFYQEAITGRQIFSSSTAEVAQAQSGSTFTEYIKDLNLLGIISGDNPQAIIEDKKTQKTYFLKRGESFGTIKVEGIGEGKVTLELQGQRFDLFL